VSTAFKAIAPQPAPAQLTGIVKFVKEAVAFIKHAEAEVAAVSASLAGALEGVSTLLPNGTAKTIVQVVLPVLVLFGRGAAKHVTLVKRATK
jgi:hypothetical protein